MRRQSAPTNATPPLARLKECPYRTPHLRSAARHCHPPMTRPSFMSRLERNRTLPVVYGGNRRAFSGLRPSLESWRAPPLKGPDLFAVTYLILTDERLT